jgi:hypothetical protein
MRRNRRATPLQRAKRLGLGLLLLSLGLPAVGCGGSGNVSGKVLYQGKPLPGGAVTFMPTSGQGAYTSRINPADGSYNILKCPAGPVRVVIVPPARSSADPKVRMMVDAVKSGRQPKPTPEDLEKMPKDFRDAFEGAIAGEEKSVPLPAKYTDPKGSELQYTVTAGNQTHDIELK